MIQYIKNELKMFKNRRKFLSLSIQGVAGLLFLSNDAYARLHKSESQKIFEEVFDCDPNTMAITPNDKFYILGQTPTLPSANDYRLTLEGLVTAGRSLTYEEITKMPATTFRNVLECISNPVGGSAIGNAEWVGTHFQNIIDSAKVLRDARYAIFTGIDGYITYHPLSALMSDTTILAWNMNEVPLPADHGWPLRLISPGYYGYKNPKWIYKIQFVDEVSGQTGTYEGAGWSTTGLIKPMSKINSLKPQMTITGETTICGVGFCPNEGIQSIQLSFDFGATWVDTELTYKGSVMEWFLWSYKWKPKQDGIYDVTVRIINKQGFPQESKPVSGFPSGASGLHKITVNVELDTTPVEEIDEGNIPKSFQLHQNYPNPFNSETKINFAVPKDTSLSLTIYNILGEVIKTLISGYYSAGTYSVTWSGTNNAGKRVASGIYLVRMTAGSFSETRKVMYLG